jgi:peptidoglycan/LPS O-acetylase OafA/YrhL
VNTAAAVPPAGPARTASLPATLWQLDAVRGAAACYIAAAHLCRERLSAQFPRLDFCLSFGQEAVVVFFLLSGFVIHLSVEQKPGLSFGRYLRARAVRLYPLLILTLLLALVIARAQHSTDPRTEWPVLLGNLLMLQDWGVVKPGVWVEVYAGVLVLWSLSYEWWFYVLYYPISRGLAAARQVWLVAALSVSQALLGWYWPNQASRFLMYFALWWTGVELARAWLTRRPLRLGSVAPSLLTLAALALVQAIAAWRAQAAGLRLQAGVHPVLELRHFVAAIGVTLGALLWHRLRWVGMRPLLGVFVYVAPWAYALYLLHEPLALHLNLFGFIAAPLGRVLADAAFVCLAAWLAETYYQRWCRRLFLP